MAKYKVEYDADTCIGTGACLSEAGEIFKEDENGFTVLDSSTQNAKGNWELIIDEALYEKVKQAEASCPVEAIKVTKIAD